MTLYCIQILSIPTISNEAVCDGRRFSTPKKFRRSKHTLRTECPPALHINEPVLRRERRSNVCVHPDTISMSGMCAKEGLQHV